MSAKSGVDKMSGTLVSWLHASILQVAELKTHSSSRREPTPEVFTQLKRCPLCCRSGRVKPHLSHRCSLGGDLAPIGFHHNPPGRSIEEAICNESTQQATEA